MIAIVDYGVGNLFSLRSSFDFIGAQVIVTDSADEIKRADRIVLPGVGAFRDAMQKLKDSGLAELIKEEASSGKPFLGICLGMQMLFEKSCEFGEYEGLGLIKGSVVPMRGVIPGELKIPHIGWNSLQFRNGVNPLFKYIKENDFVYFVHSFYASGCEESIIATTEYGAPLTGAVAKDNIYGCQFHPEKSGRTGLSILKAFCEAGGEIR